MNPSFNTAHSTPSTTKKTSPLHKYDFNNGKGFTTISDRLGIPSTPSSATPLSQPKQQFVDNMSGSTAPNSAPQPNFSSLMPGLKGLSDALGTYKNAPQSTPQPKPPTPETDYYGKSRSAMDAYIKSLQPSAEENDVQRRRDNIYASTRSGISRQEEDAIPMNFITGRQRVIENRGREAAVPLEQELARLTGNRTAQSAGEKARYEFEQKIGSETKADERYNSQITREENRYNQGTLQTLGDDLVRIRPDGSQEVVYKGSPNVKTQIVQSGGKNLLINSATGELLSDLGATEGALSRANSNANSSKGSAAVKKNNDNLYTLIEKQFALSENTDPALKSKILTYLDDATADGYEVPFAEFFEDFPELAGSAVEETPKQNFFQRLFN